MKRKTTIAKELVKALVEVSENYYGTPIIKTSKDDGWDSVTICWDGPCDWALSVSCGDNIYYGEGYGFNDPQQPIMDVLKSARDNGYYFEPNNGYQLCVAD
jgi:hypothetical protein